MSNQGWTTNESFDDWDDVSTEGPALPAPGIYEAEIGKAEAAQTGKGKPAVKIELALSGLFEGGEIPAGTSKKIFDTCTIVKETRPMVKQRAQAADIEPPANNGFEAVTDFANALVGKRVYVKVKHETYVKDGEKKQSARADRYLTREQAEKILHGDSAEGSGAGSVAADAPAKPPRTRRGAAAA